MLKYASGCFYLLYHLALIEPFGYSSCEKENSLFLLEKRKCVNILYSKKNKTHTGQRGDEVSLCHREIPSACTSYSHSKFMSCELL